MRDFWQVSDVGTVFLGLVMSSLFLSTVPILQERGSFFVRRETPSFWGPVCAGVGGGRGPQRPPAPRDRESPLAAARGRAEADPGPRRPAPGAEGAERELSEHKRDDS